MNAGDYVTDRDIQSVTAAPAGTVVMAENDDVFVGGERVTDRDVDYGHVYWLDERATILALADKHGTYRYEFVEIDPDTGEETVVLTNPDDHLRVHPVQHPTEPNRVGFASVEGTPGMTLHELDLDTGEVDELLVADRPIMHFDYSPDGESVVVQTGVADKTALHVGSRGDDEYETIRDTPEAEDFLHHPAAAFPMRSYWGEAGILFGSNPDDTADIGVLQPDGTVEWLVQSDRDKVPVGWSTDGRAAFTEARPGLTALRVVEPDGSITTISEDGTIDDAAWTASGLAYIHLDSETPAAVVVNGSVVDTIPAPTDDPVEPEHVSYESTDEETIHGLLYEPAEADRALVLAHGGPMLRAHRYYDYRKQVLADEGIAVLSVDFRGSTGYGRSFRTATDGDIGGPDVDDIVHGAKFLRHHGYETVGVAGHSYGGYLTLMSVSMTEEFDYGISLAGVTDWKAVLDAAFDSDWVVRKLGGTPDEEPEMYEGRSPITHVEKVDVPLLFLHGEEDMSVPIEMVDEYVAELEALSKPHRYVTYKGEGHGFSANDVKADIAEQMARFVQEHSS